MAICLQEFTTLTANSNYPVTNVMHYRSKQNGQHEVNQQMAVSEKEMQGKAEEESARRTKIEDRIQRYFQNKEIAKERNEENKLLFEELEQLFQESGQDEVIFTLENGEHAILSPKYVEKEVLDKDLLADELQVPKDELKTPFDFSMLTAQGKLTPAMITKHTSSVREVKMKISKRKKLGKRRKR